MRLVVDGVKGPTTVEFIYTASALVKKAREAFEAVDAVSAHARKNGDGTGLILCTTLEQQVRGLLRKEFAIQEELRRAKEADDSANERERVAGLEQSVDALRRQLKAQEKVIENYKESLALYEAQSPDRKADKSQQGEKPDKPQEQQVKESPVKAADDKKGENTKALILAQEKEILALQREGLSKNQELQKMRNTWANPERLEKLESEVARLRQVETQAEVAKAEGEAMFRRTRNLDKEAEALRHMVQALGAQLLEAKKGLLNGIPMDMSMGGPLPADQYNKAAEKVRSNMVEDRGFAIDAYRLQAALAERDDLASQVTEMKAMVDKNMQQVTQDSESIAVRDKVIEDLRQQLTNFQTLYEDTVTEMQSEMQKMVEEGAEIKRKLILAHETAIKELRDYASELEATASAERRSVALQNKAQLEEERKANQTLREQLRKSELQVQTFQKDSATQENELREKAEQMKEELLQMAEKSANQRVQIIELEKLLTEAQEEIKLLHDVMRQTADEANNRIASEVDQLQKSLAEREGKYVSGMQDLSQALHETRDQLKEQLHQKSQLSKTFHSQMQELKEELKMTATSVSQLTAERDALTQKLHFLETDGNEIRGDSEKLARENATLKSALSETRSALQVSDEEKTRLLDLSKRLERENATVQGDLQIAIENLNNRVDKEAKRKADFIQQQRHNEELLELLQQQQSTLVQNAKDMAEYEKTLVQMAAELDQFRQVPASCRSSSSLAPLILRRCSCLCN